jgi:energy-coupling factor transporter ATP-binding protein EcfA2
MNNPTTDLAIEASGLVGSFGATRALDGIDLRVPAGTVYGLLGPNGAGKTTAVRVLATLLRPDGGEARVPDHDEPGGDRPVQQPVHPGHRDRRAGGQDLVVELPAEHGRRGQQLHLRLLEQDNRRRPASRTPGAIAVTEPPARHSRAVCSTKNGLPPVRRWTSATSSGRPRDPRSGRSGRPPRRGPGRSASPSSPSPPAAPSAAPVDARPTPPRRRGRCRSAAAARTRCAAPRTPAAEATPRRPSAGRRGRRRSGGAGRPTPVRW